MRPGVGKSQLGQLGSDGAQPLRPDGWRKELIFPVANTVESQNKHALKLCSRAVLCIFLVGPGSDCTHPQLLGFMSSVGASLEAMV